MQQKGSYLLGLSQIVCTSIVVAAVVLMTLHAARAKPLDKPDCDALKREHNTLLENDLKDDIARGAQWAKDHLGQLKMQQISRLFEVEEQIAFRCKGMALTTAVVIRSLRVVMPPGIKRSAVPIPVQRPALVPTQNPRQTSASPPPSVPSEVKVSAPPNTKDTLPKVIRLQKPKASASHKARRAKARQAKARQVKARKARQRRQRSDAYVPPPVNPGYQPSLSSP